MEHYSGKAKALH